VRGRYTLGTDEEALIEAFDASSPIFDFVPRYNIAPGQGPGAINRIWDLLETRDASR